jgi:hypothetical protein
MSIRHTYLGDAVYAAFNEATGDVELRLNAHDDDTGLIILEPSVLNNLQAYLARLELAHTLPGAGDTRRIRIALGLLSSCLDLIESVSGDENLINQNHRFVAMSQAAAKAMRELDLSWEEV